MPSIPDRAWAAFGSIGQLPPDARALFGQDFFSMPGWYRAIVEAGIRDGSRAEFVTIAHDGRTVAVFPMLRKGRGAESLTAPYTCLWQPLIAPDLDAAGQRAVWRGFAAWCRGFARVRLDALDRAMADRIRDGLRHAGRGAPVPLPFDHFGNWHGAAVSRWPAYLAGRPGQIREAIRRRGKRLLADGARLHIIAGERDVAAGIESFEAVYAKSWKTPEPFPQFNATLMRECAADGSLRLGLLRQGDAILAAQFWVVQGPWAAVLKLAHDEAARAHSPGTVLTALMIDHLLTHDRITQLDFGRGDDAYKQDWVGERRQRVGLVLANPARWEGVTAVVVRSGRMLLGSLAGRSRRKLFFFEKKNQKTID